MATPEVFTPASGTATPLRPIQEKDVSHPCVFVTPPQTPVDKLNTSSPSYNTQIPLEKPNSSCYYHTAAHLDKGNNVNILPCTYNNNASISAEKSPPSLPHYNKLTSSDKINIPPCHLSSEKVSSVTPLHFNPPTTLSQPQTVESTAL